MKKTLSILLMLLMVVAASFAFGEEEVGDVARAVNSGGPIPTGHYAIIVKYADRYLSDVPGRTIYATTFLDNINDPLKPYDDLTDFYIVDIRSPKDYAAGHLPNAVNVPFATLVKPQNLTNYPLSKPILVICYTGHTASMSTAILNTLGHDAWAMRNGMSAWNCKVNPCEY
jgi:rhodanese-related sulfurtransferase